MDGLTKHKDHYHDKSGKKVFPNLASYDISELTPHKDHYHTADGLKVLAGPDGGPTGVQDKPPSETDVKQAEVETQRALQKRARRKMGSAATLLQKGSGGPYSGNNNLG